MEREFEDLGVDAVLGTQLMGLLGVSTDDFIDGARFHQFKDLIHYFKENPDMTYVINKLTVGKPVDKLNHIWGYIELYKQKQEHDKKLSDIQALKEQTDALSKDSPEYADISRKINQEFLEHTSELNNLTTQIQAYEK